MGDLRVLHQLLGDDDPEASDQPNEAVQAVSQRALVSVLPGGRPMSYSENARDLGGMAVRRMMQAWRQMLDNPSSVAYQLSHQRSRTFAEQCEHARSRAGLPPGKEGTSWETGWVVYHAVIGLPGNALGNFITKSTEGPLVFLHVMLWFIPLVALIILLVFVA